MLQDNIANAIYLLTSGSTNRDRAAIKSAHLMLGRCLKIAFNPELDKDPLFDTSNFDTTNVA